MASQWGSNSLAPGKSAGWFFARENLTDFLPVLQVMPLSPSFTDNRWYVSSGGYPYLNQLGVSTIWSQLSNDLDDLVYYMVVQNNSNNTIEYAFLEADISAGETPVPAPSAGLGSNSNYFLCNCGTIRDLSVTINVTQEQLFDFSARAFAAASKADTLLVSCGGLKTLDLLVPLEAKCKVPVVSSTPHALMNAVRLAGFSPRAMGYGSVLAKA